MSSSGLLYADDDLPGGISPNKLRLRMSDQRHGVLPADLLADGLVDGGTAVAGVVDCRRVQAAGTRLLSYLLGVKRWVTLIIIINILRLLTHGHLIST